MEESSFAGVDGLTIFTRAWRPRAATPRAVVVISHGFNSHSGYYAWVGRELAAQGFAVHALDHRGRGQSDGERFYVEKISDYTDDLHTFIGISRQRDPGLPVFLLGHSAGGVIACMYALEHQSGLSGLICESFAHEVPAPDLVLAAVKGISHIAPHAHVFKLSNKDFSRDPAVVAAMDADPLIANENQASQTVAEMVRADERLRREFPLITLPVFILHGTADKATLPSGSQHFFDRAGSRDKTLKLYEGHAHDLLNDHGKDRVLLDIVGWINARTPVHT